MKVRDTDVPSNQAPVFTHSRLEIENIIYGAPLRKSDHIVHIHVKKTVP